MTKSSNYLKGNNQTRKILLKNPDQYKVNPLQFITIQTPEAAYILGLLWADGYIRRDGCSITLLITNKTASEINWIFNKTGEWIFYFRKKTQESWQDMCEIRTGNNYLWWHLYDLDYYAKSKVSADKVLSIIPNHLKQYWFRGLVDGDGCFDSTNRKHRFSICGTYDQDWSYFIDILKNLNVRYRIEKTSRLNKNSGNMNNYSKIHIEHLESLSVFGKYIYKDREKDQMGLLYKYTKWKIIEDHFRNLPLRTSKYLYICANRRESNWKSNYKKKHIGWFKTETEAKEAQDRYALENNLPIIDKLGVSYGRPLKIPSEQLPYTS
jgi:hypothetical protein